MENIESELSELLINKGYITPKDAVDSGFTKYQFYNFVKANNLQIQERGMYISPATFEDPLLVMHKRCPSAVFSHEVAFYLHGLSEREYSKATMTIYTGYNTRRLVENGQCKVYTVKKELLDTGRIEMTDNYGNVIPVYNLERTICDLIRSRSNIEIQEFTSVLKAYAARKDKNLTNLMIYAKQFHIDTLLRTYMEVLL